MRTRLIITLSFLSLIADAQYTQQIRGIVTDQLLQEPLAGATVSIPEINQSVITNEAGIFWFNNLPLGKYKILVSFTGFKNAVLENISIISGKETVLNIPMEPFIHSEKEIVIKADSRKNKPLNDFSAVSARAFTVEETQRYAAAVNDPLRMATAFPGVLAADDGNNNIIIRGNSPTGLLWRMEGMDIPNPNHFAQPGLSGGGISILSSQLLSNSDFITAAFAPEYGNALSGVFDLKLRKGNNEKREYTLQAGVLGLNAALEGPFSSNYKGSYLVNYRYSTLTVLNKLGVLPDDGVTNFQDLSYNFYMPTKKFGTFTVFGFGGLSDESFKVDKDSSKWEYQSDRYASKYISNTDMTGITHSILLGNKLKINSGIGTSFTKLEYNEDYTEDNLTVIKNYIDKYNTHKWIFNTAVSYKYSNRVSMEAGFNGKIIGFDFYQLSREHKGYPLEERVNTKGNTSTEQVFIQWQFRPTNNITFNAGMHYLRLDHNISSSAEPRISAKWNISNRSSLAVGYGLHSQMQTLNLYFAERQLPSGEKYLPNKNLGLTKAHHYVLSYGYRLTKNLLIKTEAYYQQLFNVPVATADSNTLSALNLQYDYITDPLVNRGKGRNYGIEISVERYLKNNFYLTLSNSIYQSKYTAADGIERNTRFNGNYISTLITGKDFVNERRSKTFGVNIKTICAGGLRTTPIDFTASQQAGYTVFKEKEAYSLQNPPYFRTDLRVSMKWNRKHLTSTLSLDIQNLTNRLNIYNQYYDDEKNTIVTNHQTGLIPVLNYKIEF